MRCTLLLIGGLVFAFQFFTESTYTLALTIRHSISRRKIEVVSVRKRQFSELRGDKDIRNAPKSLRVH